MKKGFLLVLFLMCPVLLQAQEAVDSAPTTFQVSGFILEKGAKNPVLGGSLYLEASGNSLSASETPVSLSTDADLKGHYQISVPVGVYQVVVAGEGFKKMTLATFAVKTDVVKNFYLERDGFTLPEVLVSTDKAPPTQVSHESLTKEELMSVPGTGEDVLKAIQSLPGVVTTGSFNGQLFVRGSGPADNLYFADNIPIGYPYHFGIVSTIDSDLVKDIDFFAGGFGPEYLNAQGGLVDATLREPRTDRWGFRADVNLLMSEADIEGPLTSNTAMIFSYRRSYLDLFAKNFTSTQGDFEVPVFGDYQFKINYVPSPKVRWDFVAMGSSDTAGGSLSSSATVTQQDPALAGVFNFMNGYNSQGLNYLDSSDDQNKFTDTLYHINAYFNLAIGQGLYDNRTWEVFGDKASWTHDFDADTHFEAGFEYDEEYTSVNAFIPIFPGPGNPNFNFTLAPDVAALDTSAAGDGAVFADQRFTLLDKKLELNVGARMDYITYDSFFIFAPRLSAAYHLTGDTTLKVSYGYYYGVPAELSADADYIDPKLGNVNLTPEQSIASVVGVEQKLNDSGTLFRVELYEKDLSYMIVNDLATNYSNAGTGYARGIEFFLRQPPTERFYGWIAYALSDSERQNGPGQSLYDYDYDAPNVLTVVSNYKINPGWDAGIKWSYNTGLPYTPVTGANYNSTNNFYVPVYGVYNSARLPDYSRVDFETSFKTVYDTWEWRIYFDVFNLMNAKNVLGYQYSADYSSYTAQYDLPFVPYMGIEVKY